MTFIIYSFAKWGWAVFLLSSMIEAHSYQGDVKGSVVSQPTRMFGTPKAKVEREWVS